MHITRQQINSLLCLLHSLPAENRSLRLRTELDYFNLSDISKESEIANIETEFANGIANVNKSQLSNLLERARKGIENHELKKQLEFYEINSILHENIIKFLHDYIQSNEPIDVQSLDLKFSGVQVASRDNFNKIINQGWTGDWELNPNNIKPLRVQIASMNDDGPFPRGFYLNADITDIKPINGRYRIFIKNPIIINTGKRNVRFTANPVRYIRQPQ